MPTLRLPLLSVLSIAAVVTHSRADLTPVALFNGNVGLSIDAIGSNNNPVGNVQAHIPDGSTVLAAYLYSAGTPFPWYGDSPKTLADYNSSGITLNGNPINFTGLVGAVSDTRPDIGRWFTGRADVTSLVNSLRTAGVSDYSWSVNEGRLNTRIDGEVLAIVYSDPSLPQGSVALLDGGQKPGGETTTVNFSSPLTDPNAPGFVADMSLAISFSCCGQESTVNVNATRLTSAAGNPDDGLAVQDGSLITAGGLGDSNANPGNPLDTNPAVDDELYSLKSFLAQGDTGFSILTTNPTGDDNIFFMGLRISAPLSQVNDTPVEPPTGAPDAGTTLPLLGVAFFAVAALKARKAR